MLDKEIVDALPSGRTATNLAVLIPGINLSTTFSGEGQDVGGTTGDVMQSLNIHGSRGSDQRQMLDGINLGSETGGGGTGGFSPNMGSVQEVTVDTSAVSAEQVNGGVRVNLIPREGGNTVRGSFFATGSSGKLQGSNVDDELLARGLITPNELKNSYDIDPAFGGLIVRDKLWFFSAARWYAVNNYIAGSVRNGNAGNPSSWTYTPDASFRGSRDHVVAELQHPHHLAGVAQEQAESLLGPAVPLQLLRHATAGFTRGVGRLPAALDGVRVAHIHSPAHEQPTWSTRRRSLPRRSGVPSREMQRLRK